MEWEYNLSRIIITIASAIFWFIAMINEDPTLMVLALIFFSIVAFGVSCLGTIFSKVMIKIGDRISNKFLCVFYYVGLFVGIVVFSLLGFILITTFGDSDTPSTDMGEALSQALLILFYAVSFVIVLVIPYLQTLIVLFLRKMKGSFVKKESE